jgi:enterochelin esterase-like enzyme
MLAVLPRSPTGLVLAVPPAASHRALPRPRHHRPRLVRLIRIPPDLLHRLGRSGPLESPWLAAAIAMLLVASIAMVLWRARRRRRLGLRPRHRGLRRLALGGWLGLLVLLGSAAGLNAYVGYVPTLPALFGALPGHPDAKRFSRVETLVIGAPALDMPPERLYVYLPPGYDAHPKRRYPVVYLLHGYPGGPLDWFRAAEVQDQMDALLRYHLVQPMVIVAPNANGGWLHDSEMLNQVDGPQVETYLTRTIVAAIDARYRTVPARSGRAIGGMSSGGYGALNLGLRHQATYAVILSMMPYGDPGPVTTTLLGGSHALWLANSPSHYIPVMRFRYPTAVFLAAGSKDSKIYEARLLARLLARRGQLAVVKEVAGATHTWHGARAEIPYALAFASQHLTTTVKATTRTGQRRVARPNGKRAAHSSPPAAGSKPPAPAAAILAAGVALAAGDLLEW